MKTYLTTASLFLLTAPMAFAQQVDDCPPGITCGGSEIKTTVVPEISALEGTAALAVLAAVVLLVWERRRRAV